MRRAIASTILVLVAACVALAVVPSPPTPVAPVYASTGNPTNVTIQWAEVASVDSYALKIGMAGDATDPYYTLATGTLTKALLFRAGEKYYWRVRAKNADGWGSYSATMHFFTAPWPESGARRRRH